MIADFSKLAAAESGAGLKALCISHLPELKKHQATVEELLFLNDIFRKAELFQDALIFLERIKNTGQTSGAFYEKLGFTLLKLGRADEALGVFRDGCEHFPEWRYNWLGSLIAQRTVGRPVQQYANDALAVADSKIAYYGHDALVHDSIRAAANWAFERGERSRLKSAFAVVCSRKEARTLDKVRYLEILTHRAEFQEAAKVYADIRNLAHELEPSLRAAVANYLGATGQHSAALALYSFIWLEAKPLPHHVITLINLIHNAGTLEDFFDQIRALIKKMPEDGAIQVSVHLALRRRQYDDAVRLVVAHGAAPFSQNPHIVIDASYKALEANDLVGAEKCIEVAKLLLPGSNTILKLEANYLFQRQEWEKAETLLATASDDTLLTDPEMLQKKFELLCFQGRYAEAEVLGRKLHDLHEDKPGIVPSLLRFYAETSKWDKIMELATEKVLSSFRFSQVGDILVKAALELRATDELKARVSRTLERGGSRAELGKLLHIIRELDAQDYAQVADAIMQLDDDCPIAVRHRLEAKLALLAPEVVADGQETRSVDIFLCADRKYFLPAMVCISSMLRSNPALPQLADVHLVTEDIDSSQQAILDGVEKAFGAKIHLHDAGSLVGSDSPSEKYGVFTSGEKLSKAAYYRIYFAKKLAQTRRSTRALYIDSDIVIRGSIHKLLQADMNGKPIMARLEINRPEVLRAQTLHGLPANSYFNSGVLLFDFSIDGCIDRINRAIDESNSPTSTLLFHDQCALNKAFSGAATYMPSEYNFFCDGRTREEELANGVFLHFLDRPKPWKSTYTGAGSRIWFDELLYLAAVTGCRRQVLEMLN